MRFQRWHTTIVVVGWMAAALTGCKGLFGPRGIPADPLLHGRQPIESKGQMTPFRGLTHHEPQPPGKPIGTIR